MMRTSLFLCPLGLALFWVVGCSANSSTNEPCNLDPWGCPAGQTCWPATETSFACLNSGSGIPGAACQDTVGSPTCGDTLGCLEIGPSGGVCSPYCDEAEPSHACPAGQTCKTAFLLGAGGAQFQICETTSTIAPSDGGNDASALDSESTESPDTETIVDSGVPLGDGSVPAECTAWSQHLLTACPGGAAQATIDECVQGESLYAPEGCGAEWQAYVTCATQATYDCMTGTPNGCDMQHATYFACQSEFVSSTGCDRVGEDSKCTVAAPYSFVCLSGLPTGCVPIASEPGAPAGCCPAFPAR
jgi:hypothetical protein